MVGDGWRWLEMVGDGGLGISPEDGNVKGIVATLAKFPQTLKVTRDGNLCFTFKIPSRIDGGVQLVFWVSPKV